MFNLLVASEPEFEGQTNKVAMAMSKGVSTEYKMVFLYHACANGEIQPDFDGQTNNDVVMSKGMSRKNIMLVALQPKFDGQTNKDHYVHVSVGYEFYILTLFSNQIVWIMCLLPDLTVLGLIPY